MSFSRTIEPIRTHGDRNVEERKSSGHTAIAREHDELHRGSRRVSRHATEFLAYMPLLTKARDAYQRAMAVSAEVRSMLDTGDGTLRTLMAQLEDAVSFHLGKTATGKKTPESVKVDPALATSQEDDSTWALPK